MADEDTESEEDSNEQAGSDHEEEGDDASEVDEPEAAEPEADEPEADEPEEPEPLPGEGTEDGTALREAHAAFAAGDYRRVRERSERLFEAKDAAVARAARELHGRTEVDPVQVGVLLACLILFALIAYTYVF